MLRAAIPMTYAPKAAPAHEAPASLLGRVAAGVPGAVDECIARYGGLVWTLARRFSSNSADAEDATQEIFLDLWRSAARFDPIAASETTFVALIARRRLIDRRRRRQRRGDTEPLDLESTEALLQQAQSSDAGPELCAEAAIAAKALCQLRPEQRHVVILSSYYGLSHEEIASTTGMALGTVKAHARRGLLRLRDFLDRRPEAQGGGS